MMAVFFVTLIEMLFTRGLCKQGVPDGTQREVRLEAGMTECCPAGGGSGTVAGMEGCKRGGAVGRVATAESEEIGGKGGLGRVGFGMVGKRRSRSHSFGQRLQKYEEMEKQGRETSPTTAHHDRSLAAAAGTPDDDIILEMRNRGNWENSQNNNANGDDEGGSQISAAHKPFPGRDDLSPEQMHKKALLQCALLEMGILFHSVFIGMALSVTGGSDFVVLLIAVIFHRSF